MSGGLNAGAGRAGRGVPRSGGLRRLSPRWRCSPVSAASGWAPLRSLLSAAPLPLLAGRRSHRRRPMPRRPARHRTLSSDPRPLQRRLSRRRRSQRRGRSRRSRPARHRRRRRGRARRPPRARRDRRQRARQRPRSARRRRCLWLRPRLQPRRFCPRPLRRRLRPLRCPPKRPSAPWFRSTRRGARRCPALSSLAAATAAPSTPRRGGRAWWSGSGSR